MARLTLDLPSELGCAGQATEAGCGVESHTGSGVESRAQTGYPSIVDDATRTFVRWFDCWAGR